MCDVGKIRLTRIISLPVTIRVAGIALNPRLLFRQPLCVHMGPVTWTPCDRILWSSSLHTRARSAAIKSRTMGMDQPNGEHSDETHTNGGKKGYDSPVKGVDSQTLIPHYNGKGKDVIGLYR